MPALLEPAYESYMSYLRRKRRLVLLEYVSEAGSFRGPFARCYGPVVYFVSSIHTLKLATVDARRDSVY
jgi:hypothetical protein